MQCPLLLPLILIFSLSSSGLSHLPLSVPFFHSLSPHLALLLASREMHDFWLVLRCEPSFPSAVKGLWCPYLYSLVQVGLSPVTIKLNRIPFQIYVFWCLTKLKEYEGWARGIPEFLSFAEIDYSANHILPSLIVLARLGGSCKLNIFLSSKMKFKVAIFLKYFINVSYRGCPKLY